MAPSGGRTKQTNQPERNGRANFAGLAGGKLGALILNEAFQLGEEDLYWDEEEEDEEPAARYVFSLRVSHSG